MILCAYLVSRFCRNPLQQFGADGYSSLRIHSDLSSFRDDHSLDDTDLGIQFVEIIELLGDPLETLTRIDAEIALVEAVRYENLFSKLLSYLSGNEKSPFGINFLVVSGHFVRSSVLIYVKCGVKSEISSTFLHLDGNFLPKSPHIRILYVMIF